jgi:hypothetical protein
MALYGGPQRWFGSSQRHVFAALFPIWRTCLRTEIGAQVYILAPLAIIAYHSFTALTTAS